MSCGRRQRAALNALTTATHRVGDVKLREV